MEYTQEEIASIMNMGKILASKPVITYVKSLVEIHVKDPKKAAKLTRALDTRMEYNYCGHVSLEFDETPVKLNVSLSIVPRDYVTEIDIPDAKYAKDLIDKYNVLKKMAVAYWAQFQADNAGLYAKLQAAMPDIKLDSFEMDPAKPTTIYLDVNSPKRVGVFCYYTNPDGRPMVKK